MNYEIISDAEQIEQFRGYISINMFNDLKEKTANKELSLRELPEYFIEHNIKKEDRRLFQINPFTFGKKTRHFAMLPHTIVVDIDAAIKDPNKPTTSELKRQQLLFNDLRVKTIEDAINKLIDIFKNDECCYFIAKTQSGEGVKALFNIITKEFITEPNYVYTNDNGTMLNKLMDNNYNIIKDYLTQYNLVEHIENDKEIGYLDPTAANITQGFFSTQYEFYVKEEAHIIKDIRLESFSNVLNDNEFSASSKVTKDQLETSNQLFTNNFIKYVKQINNNIKKSELSDKKIKELFDDIGENNEEELKQLNNYIKKENKRLFTLSEASKTEKNRINKALKPYFEHMTSDRGLELRYSLKYLGDDKQIEFYYGLYKTFYTGKKAHLFLNDFEQFKNNIRSLEGTTANYLFNIFRPVFTTNPLNNRNMNSDFLNYKYDTIYEFNEYVTEKKDEIFNIFNNNNISVLKGAAGGGKTTLIQDYFMEQLHHNINTAVFVIPTNGLLAQQYEIISKKLDIYNKNNGVNINIIKNYGGAGKNEYHNYEHKYGEKVLILSSTVEMDKIINPDLIVIDEIHNLVMYSDTIISNNDKDCKLILTSATPEIYLIGMDRNNFHYVNLEKIDVVKKEITLINNSQYLPLLRKLVDKNRRQLIFLNNYDTSKKVAVLFEHIDFKFINSKDKNTEDVKEVIENEKLYHSHYIVTSFISAGINFLNSEEDIKFDDIIIIENHTLSAFEIYQLSNRFRYLPDINIIMLCKTRRQKYNKEYDLKEFHDVEKFKRKKRILQKSEKELSDVTGDNNGAKLLHPRYFINKNGDFILNNDTLKMVIFEKFHNDYMKYSDIFFSSLTYYFNLKFEYFEIDAEDISQPKKEKIFDTFLNNFDEILKILVFIKQNIDGDNFDLLLEQYENMNKTSKVIIDMLYENQSFMERAMKRIDMLNVVGLNLLEYKDKLVIDNNQFSRWKNIKTKKLLGDNKKGDDMDTFSKDVWKVQNKLLVMIKKMNIIRVDKNDVEFFTIDDLLEKFKRNNKQYDKMKNKDDEYLFKLTKKDIGSFLSSIGRHYKQARKRVDGESRRVYTIVNEDVIKEDENVNIHKF